jgi:hypothetical protein
MKLVSLHSSESSFLLSVEIYKIGDVWVWYIVQVKKKIIQRTRGDRLTLRFGCANTRQFSLVTVIFQIRYLVLCEGEPRGVEKMDRATYRFGATVEANLCIFGHWVQTEGGYTHMHNVIPGLQPSLQIHASPEKLRLR